jgi:hypothetical protein
MAVTIIPTSDDSIREILRAMAPADSFATSIHQFDAIVKSSGWPHPHHAIFAALTELQDSGDLPPGTIAKTLALLTTMADVGA